MTKSCFSGLFLLAFSTLAICAGCGGSEGMGATTGGAQNNDLAQTQVNQGQVPKPIAFTVEGLLNQYDLPLESQTCTQDLCIDAGYGVAPVLVQDRSSVFVQLGFSSGIDPATFRRAPLNLSVVVDRSGSMAGAKMNSVKLALQKLIDRLGEGDRLSIVLFDDQVEVLLPPALVTNRAALKAAVDRIAARNATNMSAGLRKGTALVQANAGIPGISDRIVVFTDANTNTGDTDQESFVELVTSNAAQNIGLTLFGVGTDLNQDLVLHITEARGGNYFFLKNSAEIAEVFDVDFDYLVTPLAYDLQFQLVPASGFTITAVYGFPSWRAGSSVVQFSVPTVFLSRNHGAIVVRLDPTNRTWPLGTSPLAELSMTYSPANGGVPVTQTLEAAYAATDPLTDNTIFYSQRAVRKSVALVNEALAQAKASDYYWNQSRDVSSANALLERTSAMLAKEAGTLEDLDLATEAKNVQKLEQNITYGSKNYAYDQSGEGTPFGCSITPGEGSRAIAPWGASALGLLALLRRRSRKS